MDGIVWKATAPVIEAQDHPGLPTLQDWLNFGMRGMGGAPRGSGNMSAEDWQECRRMSPAACQDYQRRWI